MNYIRYDISSFINGLINNAITSSDYTASEDG